MRVRMLSARGGYPCGVVCDVPDDLARAWCADLTCEPVPDPPPFVEAMLATPAPETAMRAPVRRGRPKGRA